MPDYILRNALQNLLTAMPLFIVWVVGIVIAIVQWKKSPRKSIISIIAFLLLLFGFLFELAFNTFGIQWLNTSRAAFGYARTLSIIIPLFFNLLRTTAWVFILLAIFGKTKALHSSNEATEKMPEN